MKIPAAVAAALWCCAAAHALEPAQVLEKVAPSLVLVRALGDDERLIRSGGGVVVGRGQVVTNCHLLAKAKSVQVGHQEVIYPATLQHADVGRDLCQLNSPKLPAPAVLLSSVQAVRLSQRVYAVAPARGTEPVLSEGVISVLREYRGMPIIQTTAKVSEEVSGIGLFDSDGKLVGITTILVKDAPGNYAIAADAIRELPQRAKEELDLRAAAVAAGKPVSRPREFAQEWAARVALLEKPQGDITLSQALAILLDISATEDVELLQEHEKSVSSRQWSSAYAIGTDAEGRLIWAGAYAWSRPEYAAETALQHCAKEHDDICKVVFVNGNFRLAELIALAKTLGQVSIANVRQAYLTSLTRFPVETQVGRTSGSQLGQFAYAYTSIRD